MVKIKYWYSMYLVLKKVNIYSVDSDVKRVFSCKICTPIVKLSRFIVNCNEYGPYLQFLIKMFGIRNK